MKKHEFFKEEKKKEYSKLDKDLHKMTKTAIYTTGSLALLGAGLSVLKGVK